MGASESKPDRRIVLIGATGDGKSSAGNTILRKKIFTVKSSPSSETATSESRDGMVDGRKITVIDTPGIFNTDRDEKTIKREIISSIVDCALGVDALVIVFKVGRYTKQSVEIVDKMVEYCGEKTFKHAVILFTHGEDLEDQTIEEFVKKNPKLQELINKCRGHCHVIDNKYWKNRRNKVHVRNLLDDIEKMIVENGPYKNEVLQIVKENIEDEIANIKEKHISSEEKREKAKKNVVQQLLIKLAGVATGTLIGALLGVRAAVAVVVPLLKTGILQAVSPIIELAEKATGARIGAPAVIGITAGVIIGTAGLAGAIGGGITGYKAAEEADSVLDARNKAAKATYENAEKVVGKVEQLKFNVH